MLWLATVCIPVALFTATCVGTNLDVTHGGASSSQSAAGQPESLSIYQRDLSLELPGCAYFASHGRLSTSTSLASFGGEHGYPIGQRCDIMEQRRDAILNCLGVDLAARNVPESDNRADWVDSFSRRDAFIASAAPQTDEDERRFWNMVWNNNVRVIAMLTKPIEEGEFKSTQYWPTEHFEIKEISDAYEITAIEVEDPHDGYVCVLLEMQKLDETSVRRKEVTHCLFTEWPDMGIPERADRLLDFWKHVKQLGGKSTLPSPILVHCRAGRGRTETFIAIDVLIERMESEAGRPVDLMGVVLRLFVQRLAVLTQAQYEFCITALRRYDILIRQKEQTKLIS